MNKIKIAWLAPYPTHEIESIDWAVKRDSLHPCSWVVNLAETLAQRPDVELHILTLCPWVKKSQIIDLPEGYTLHVLKNGIPLIHRGYPAYFPLNIATAFRGDRKKIVRRIKEICPDVVHGHGTEVAFGRAAVDSGFPAVISMQAVMAELAKVTPSYSFKRRAVLERRAVEQARFFMGRTHYDMGFVRSINPTAEIFDVPEAINQRFFEDPWNDPPGRRVLFVGSFLPHKGVPLLLEAMGIVRKAIPEVALDLVGAISTDVRLRVEEQLAAQGMLEQTRFHGFLSPERIAKLHRECSLFVLPSLNDNSPNALAEAMVSGMPIVAHNVGGVASMFEDGISGTLVECGDIDALAFAIQDLLVNRDKRVQMGLSAQAQTQRNRPSAVAEQTLAAYRTIISGDNSK